MTKNIGLIGLGYWGKNILRNLYELGAIHSACDSDYKIVSQRNSQFPGINYTYSHDELINNPEIKAVIVATPAETHYRIVKQALLANKDVMVEKPLALIANDGEDIINTAKRNNKILMVGHILQYHPAIIKMKELLTSGQLGKVHYVYSNRLNIGKLRTEENILWSFAPHDISVILMLLNEEPIKVSAMGGDYVSKGIYDTTLTTLEFKNEIKGHIFVSWLHPFKEQKLIVVGSKAMAVFDDVSNDKLTLYPHKIEWKDGKIPIAQKAEYEVVPFQSSEPLKEELEHFIKCVETRDIPKTDGIEGLKVLKILEAVEQSLAVNGCAVNVSTIKNIPSNNIFIHNTAVIDEHATIGDGTKIWHFSHILKGTHIGDNCTIGQNISIGPDVDIGNNCKIQNNVSIYKGVTLEDDVFCGPSCVFTNVYNPRAFIERKKEFKPTLIKKGSTIGANATIVCGVTVGKYAMIGAGAVVKSDVPDHAIMTGVAAKQTGWACKCGTTLRFQNNNAVCSYCSNEYMIDKRKLVLVRE
ncbi:oxidoreductase domain-containing protein [Candidatus Magnetoovum chiemensis]|nr:oxidoreductase domain-containing protein [Candidatus Magnetoovum chiemensis]